MTLQLRKINNTYLHELAKLLNKATEAELVMIAMKLEIEVTKENQHMLDETIYCEMKNRIQPFKA